MRVLNAVNRKVERLWARSALSALPAPTLQPSRPLSSPPPKEPWRCCPALPCPAAVRAALRSPHD